MRLSQIARKLGAMQSELSEKLVANGEKAPEGGNSKLTDDQIALLFKLYNYVEPEETKEEVEVKENIETAHPDEPAIDIKEEVVEEEPPAQVEEIGIESSTEVSEPEEIEPEEEIEVIRAKKIKLEGIKVLGKIELPEKPAKVKEENEDEVKSNYKDRRRKPELTFEEKQVLEERKRLREKRKREKEIKEKKKKYFEQNIKPKQEQIGVKQKKKKKREISKATPEKRTQIKSKNPFKRFWIWLNDPYA